MNEEQHIKQLPKDWKWVKLGDVCNVVTGTTPPKSDSSNYGNYIPFFKPPHLWDGIISETDEMLSLRGSEKARIVPANTVLVTCIGNLGRTGYVKKRAAFNQQINAIEENENIVGKFIFYQAQSPLFKRQLEKLATGTTVSIVNKSNFETITIPLPPLPTQLAIVSKIEELFSELDKGIENLRTAQQQIKTYRQAVLKWAFEGKLTNSLNHDELDAYDENALSMAAEPTVAYKVKNNNGSEKGELPDGWRNVSITELVEKNKNALKAGPFGSSLKKEFYVNKGYKIYGQEQVISGDAFYGDYYINEEKYQELSSCRIKPNDVLISLVGTVGKVLILPENCHQGIINPRLIKISLDRSIYSPKFFKYYFESSFVKSFYGAETRGTTMDVLNLGIIKTIPFPLCTIDEQEKIVQEIESRLSVSDKMEESIIQSLQQAEALRQSILKKAFEGKLI
jgi:type I restriction enzyme S subunit